MKQALLYVGCYVLSYGFVWAQTIYMLATNMSPPTALTLLSSLFFPAQGFINIFIYCRPHIVSLRREFPSEYTWFQAFVRVLKSGGDDPLTTQERRLHSIRRASTKFSLISEMDFTDGEVDAAVLSSVVGLNRFSESDSNDSIAGLIRKAELCERRRSSFGPQIDIEDPTEVASWSHNSKHIEMLESSNRSRGEDMFSIPNGDAGNLKSLESGALKDVALNHNGDGSKHETTAHPEEDAVRHEQQEDVKAQEDRNGLETREMSDDDSSQNSKTNKSLDEIIHDAEKVLEETMGEFLAIANEEGSIETKSDPPDNRSEYSASDTSLDLGDSYPPELLFQSIEDTNDIELNDTINR